MNTRHKLIHFISLLAIVVNLLMPLGAPLVTAEDILPQTDTTVTSDQTSSEGDTGAAQVVGENLDPDGDGINTDLDNCPDAANADQTDTDGDGIGDACDPVNDLDVDGDLVNNDADNCPDVANSDQADIDGDGLGNACDLVNDLDLDNDGVNDAFDNCPGIANGDQADADGDGIGDACDPVNDLDRDGDGVANDLDNCPDVANGDQADLDNDGVGDPCDSVDNRDSDGDGVLDTVDACPTVKPVKDADGDGCEDPAVPTATTAPTETPKPTEAPTATSVPTPESRQVSPAAPAIDASVCADPTVVAPGMTPADTEGLVYSVTGPDKTGQYQLTATLQPGYTWSNDGKFNDWAVNGSVATYTPQTATLCPTPGPKIVELDVSAAYTVEKIERTGEEYRHELPLPGDTVVITLTIKNLGTDPVNNINITSTPDVDGEWTCTPALDEELAVGGSISCVGKYEITDDDFGSKTLEFTFEVSATAINAGAQRMGIQRQAAPTFEETMAVTLAPAAFIGDYPPADNSDIRYADSVVVTIPGTYTNVGSNSCPTPNNDGGTFEGITGVGDHPSGQTIPDERAPSLGWNGQVVVYFSNNVLVGNGVTGNNAAGGDLMILERGAAAEPTRIRISGTKANGTPTGWLLVGQLSGSSNANTQYFDIDSLLTGDLVGAQFTAVELTDLNRGNYNPCSGGVPNYAGADIDAVWAISSFATPTFTPPIQEACVNGTQTNLTWYNPADTDAIDYTVVNETRPNQAPAPGDTIRIEGRLKKYAWSAMPPGWTLQNGVAIYRVPLQSQRCVPTKPLTVNATNAMCSAGTVNQHSITIPSFPGGTVTSITRNGTAVTLNGSGGFGNYSFPGNADQTIVVTVTISGTYAWESGNSWNGWTLVNATTATYSKTFDAAKCAATIPTITLGANVCTGVGTSTVSLSYGTGTATIASVSINGTVDSTAPFPTSAAGGALIVITYSKSADNVWPTTMPNLGYGGTWTDGANGTKVYTFTAPTKPCVTNVSILKQANDTVFVTGDTIEFTITVTNAGDFEATGVSFTDTLDSALIGSAGLTWSENSDSCSIAGGVLTCEGITLAAANAGTTDQFSVTLTSSAITATNPVCGEYTNTAILTGDYADVASNSSTVSFSIDCDPAYSIAKESALTSDTAPTGLSVGDTITYTIVLTNTGNEDLTGLLLNDVFEGAGSLTWVTPADGMTIPVIPVGGNTTLTATYIVLQPDVDAGEIENCAYITNEGLRGDTVPGDNCVTDVIQRTPRIDARKTTTVETVDGANDVITYEIQIENTGNVALNGVSVTDSLTGTDVPESITWGAATSNLPGGFSQDPFGGTIGTLRVGETVTITASYTVSQDDIDNGGTILNCVGAATTGASDPIPTAPGESDNCAPTTITQRPGVDVGKSFVSLNPAVVAPAAVVNPGDTISFNITVENTGNTTRTNVVVSDGVAIGNGTIAFGTPTGGTITVNGNQFTVTSNIAPDGVVTVPVTYTITQQDIDRGSMQNCASTYPQVGNDPDCAPVTIPQSATFTFTKEGPTAPVVPGEAIQFTVTFTNTGNVTIANATIADVLPALPSGTWDIALGGASESPASFPYQVTDLAPGKSVILIATAMVPAEIETPNTTWCKQWDNTATVTGSFANQAPISGTDSASAQVNCTSLQITKSGPSTATPGGSITYTIVVENLGNTTVFNAMVTDDLDESVLININATVASPSAEEVCGVDADGVVTCGISSLAPGQIATVTITADVIARPSVTQCDTDLTNSATLSGFRLTQVVTARMTGTITPPGTVITSNTVTTDIVCTPKIEWTKTVADGTVAPGEDIEFTITVRNTGTYYVNDLVVTDTLPAGLAGLNWTVVDNDAGATCERVGAVVTCSNIDLPAYTGLVTITLTAPTTAEAPVCGDYTNQATLSNSGLGNQRTADVTITCVPKVEASKSTTTMSVTEDGVTINYTIQVENTGNKVLTGLAVDDDLTGTGTPANVVWGNMPAGVTLDGNTPVIGSLGIDGVVILSASYTVSQADMDAGGTIQNCITVEHDQYQLDNCARTTVVQTPGIDIEKSAEIDKTVVLPNERLDAGDEITYTITVENTGNVTLTNVVVSDPLAGVSETIPSLAPDAAPVEFTVTYTITQDDLDMGSVYNCADTTGEPPLYEAPAPGFMAQVIDPTEPVSDEDCITTELEQDPSIDVEKTGSVLVNVAGEEDRVDAGDQIEYTITVENTGNVTLTNVAVNDPLVGLSETIISLAPGVTKTFTVTYEVTQVDLDAGMVQNCADVVADGPAVQVPLFAAMQEGEAPYATDDACIDTELEHEPAIDIEKTFGVFTNIVGPEDRIDAGDHIEFTITVENTGNVTLTNVAVNDPLVSLSETITSLAPGEMKTFTVIYVITQSDLDAGEVLNCADVTGDGPVMPQVLSFAAMQEAEEPYVSDEDCITAPLENVPGISIVKTATVLDSVAPADRVDAGDTIEYTFTVVNTGNVTLENVVVDDPLPNLTWVDDPNIGTMLPGDEVVLKATYVVTQPDLDAGEVENCADVTGQPPLIDIIEDRITVAVTGDEPMPTSLYDEDCVTTDLPGEPGVDLEKTGSAATGDDDVLNLDEVITYTFAVTNTGNVTLTDLTIDDPLVGLEWTDGNTISSLAPGETVELTATYTVTQADVDFGTVVNCADLSGSAPDDTAVADDDCDTQVIDQNPAILVALVCPSPEDEFLPAVGDEVAFKITVSNDGDLTVSDIEVTTSREGELDSPFPTELQPGQSVTREFTLVITQADYDARSITLEVSAEGTLPDGSSARLASMAMMQTLGDSVENALSLQCPMGEQPQPKPTPKPPVKPTPKPPVTNLPNTGSGSIAASGSIIWAAAFAMIAFGASAIGIRRKYQ